MSNLIANSTSPKDTKSEEIRVSIEDPSKLILNKENEGENITKIASKLALPFYATSSNTTLVEILTEDLEKVRKITKAKEIKKNKIDYTKIYQDKHTNYLVHNLNKNTEIDILGNGKIIGKDYEITIEGIESLKQSTSAVRLFDLFTLISVQTDNTLAEIPLDEYMNLRGLKDKKTARKQVSESIKLLENIKIKYKGTGKNSGNWFNFSISGGTSGIKNSVVYFRFNQDYFDSVNKKQFMYTPEEYWRINDNKNPHSTYFFRKLAEHTRINIGKLTGNIIGVKSLIESSPIFPEYKEHFERTISKPFERDLDVIKSIKWNFCGTNGEEAEQPNTYKEFTKLNVYFEWNEYIDTTELVKKRKQEKQKSIKIKL